MTCLMSSGAKEERGRVIISDCPSWASSKQLLSVLLKLINELVATTGCLSSPQRSVILSVVLLILSFFLLCDVWLFSFASPCLLVVAPVEFLMKWFLVFWFSF